MYLHNLLYQGQKIWKGKRWFQRNGNHFHVVFASLLCVFFNTALKCVAKVCVVTHDNKLEYCY